MYSFGFDYMPDLLTWVGLNQRDIKTKTTMKKTLLIASVALLFASCERCWDLRITTKKTFNNPSNGAWQKDQTTVDEETVCGMTYREVKKYEASIEGESVSIQGKSKVTTNVIIRIQ